MLARKFSYGIWKKTIVSMRYSETIQFSILRYHININDQRSWRHLSEPKDSMEKYHIIIKTNLINTDFSI